MYTKRTDLALEAQELWQEGAEKTAKLSGVKAGKSRREGYPVTRVEILDAGGAKTLGKPVGTYLTLDLTAYWQRKEDYFQRAVRALGAELKAMLPGDGAALVIGLGNRAMTPDAVGPLTLESVLITRHLRAAMPKQFGGFRPVSAFSVGVLGTTGVESAEAVRGLVKEVEPDFVIAVDALASRRTGRVCPAQRQRHRPRLRRGKSPGRAEQGLSGGSGVRRGRSHGGGRGHAGGGPFGGVRRDGV